MQTNIDIKYLDSPIIINQISTQNDTYYIYKVTCNGVKYILKGFRFDFSLLASKVGEDAVICKVYQDYFTLKAISRLSPHFVKSLYMNYEVAYPNNLYIEILYEDKGIELNELGTVKLETTYKLIQQSTNVLLLPHRLNLNYFNLESTNMLYDEGSDTLKVISMGEFKDKDLKNDSLSFVKGFFKDKTLKQPHNLRLNGSVDMHYWTRSFYSLIFPKDIIDSLISTSSRHSKELVEDVLNSVNPKNNKEAAMKNFIEKIFTLNINEKLSFQEVFNEMKELERTRLAQLENKVLSNLLILHNEVDGERINKGIVEREVQNDNLIIYEPYSSDYVLKEVELSCKHTLPKKRLITYVLKKFIRSKAYDYQHRCFICNTNSKLLSILLDCGCRFNKQEMIKRCNKGHVLTNSDFGLVNDYSSFENTALILNEHLEDNKNLLML
jgi:hypothetical protein